MKTFFLIIFSLVASTCFGQKASKLSKRESAQLTQEQRNVRSADRKSKGGKNDLSMKKRVRIDQKEDRRARSVKSPKKRKYKRKSN